MDRLSIGERSENMSKIKSKDTSIEIKFRKNLFHYGIRYSLNYPLIGKPDLVLSGKKIAIFVNGCFWHQHKNCKMSYMPKTNAGFWKSKLSKNIARDLQVDEELKHLDWKVIRVWECEIESNIELAISRVMSAIN